MAVAAIVGRPGSNDGNANTISNLLKVFAGEVILAFEESNLFLGLTEVKNVSGNAISWTWPVVGHGSVSYHKPGDNILTDTDAGGRTYLKTIKTAQRQINMDRKLMEPVFFDELDQKLVHWDWRQKVAGTIGQDLARAIDINIQRLLWQVGIANGGATISGGFAAGGTFGSLKIDVGAFASLTPAALVKAIWDAKINFDKKYVPKNDRYCVMAPEVMQRFFFNNDGTIATGIQWVDADFNSSMGGFTSNGSFREGKVPMIAGIKLIEHVNVDFALAGLTTGSYGVYDYAGALGGDGTAGTGGTAGETDNIYDSNLAVINASIVSNNDYTVTYTQATSTPILLIFQKEAAATVKLEDLSIQSEYMIEYQGDVTVARLVLGHGVLRPECVVAVGDFS